MNGMGCYDDNECIQWHVCRPGSCRVREQVEKLRSQEHEDADTVAPRRQYLGEDTEIIPGDLTRVYINDPVTGELTRAIGNTEPETMSFQTFQIRDDLSLSEEDVAGLRERFDALQDRSLNVWGYMSLPLPPQVVADYEAGQNAMTRTYPKHRCLLCWLVSWLPGHHRCAHGRLVCEQCEVEASGW